MNRVTKEHAVRMLQRVKQWRERREDLHMLPFSPEWDNGHETT